MRRVLSFMIIFSFLFSFAVTADKDWMKNYKLALSNLDKQDLISALYFIDKAVISLDEPKADMKDESGKKFDYIPYYYLGIIYYRMGKYNLALSSFELSEKYGVINKKPVLADNLKKYRLFVHNKLILKLTREPVKLSPKEEEKFAARKKYLADEYELTTGKTTAKKTKFTKQAERLLYAVRKELKLPNEAIGIYPWYFYYERALKYVEENQWSDALLYLSESLLRKPVSRENARRYGVWFKDYTPYIYVSYIAWMLDMRTISKEAFNIALNFGVVNPASKTYKKMESVFAE